MLSLFPAPLVLRPCPDSMQDGPSESSSSALPTISAHLMPFHIEHTGPAPVDRYLVLHSEPSAPSTASESTVDQPTDVPGIHSSSTAEPSQHGLRSAFRGRLIEATTLPLPEGYTGWVVELPQTSAVEESTSLRSGRGGGSPRKKTKSDATADNPVVHDGSGLRRSPRKSAGQAPLPFSSTASKPRVAAKVFSLDSDEEDEEDSGGADDWQRPDETRQEMAGDDRSDNEDDEWDMAPVPPKPVTKARYVPSTPRDGGGGEPGRVADQNLDVNAASLEETRALRPVAHFDSILVWGADGPVDEGDDALVRGLREWVGVVGPALHSHS